ncbi:MAG: S9 family peptidase [Holophaga sp.]|nr:S9 family peptidase [Holophaga sp.]
MRLPSFLCRIGFTATTLVVGLGLAPGSLKAAAPKKVEKKVITHDVYDRWRSIKDTALSRQGDWLAYTLALQDGDGEVVARNLKTGQEWRHARGASPSLTADGRFVAFAITPPKAEVDKAKKDKKKPEEMPKAGLGVMNLASGKVETLERVKSFRFAKEGGRYLAALRDKPEEKKGETKGEPSSDEADQRARGTAASGDKDSKKKEPGTDLVLWELTTGRRVTIPDVAEYLWNRDGAWLAYTISVKEATKGKDKAKEEGKAKDMAAAPDPAKEGTYLWRATDDSTVVLLAGQGTYKGLATDEQGTRLAFLTNRDEAKAEAPAFKLYGWKDGEAAATEIVSKTSAGMPKSWAPSEHGRLEFTKDGLRLFFGTAPLPKAEPKEAPEPVKVDLWHWKDADLQPMQKVRAEDEKKRSFRAVVHLNERLVVQLGSEELPDVETNENANVALGFAPNAYLHLASWDQAYADVFALDLRSGAKTLLAPKIPWSRRSNDGPGRGSHLSPGGRYLFHFDSPRRAWMVVPTQGGPAINLTQNLKVAFQEEEHDTPELPGAYGIAGWTSNDEALLAYDRFDVWELKPTGARNLTAGAGRNQKTVLRYLRLDPDEKMIPKNRPLMLSGVKEETKATGFFRAGWTGAEPLRLLWADQLMGGLQKAKDAEVVVFTRQRFDLFPDLWAADSGFAKPAKVTDANPQQAQYLWGQQELIDYVNADGKVLKALITKPENFDPAKKYPLMVYIYEKYSDRLHGYQAPAPGTSINFTRFASNGYVILRPDIVYETGYPGESALKCVLPAIEKLASLGFIDRDRIGIQGHSWGAYQIAYLVGRTHLFKAAEAGAPVSDMISAYGGIRWGTGMSRAFQYEKSQSRIGAPPWERPLQYIENSPLFWVEKVQTPLLMIHNDDDDAVPWYQGIEFFSALRRLGKPVWMFNFNGDKHNLVQRENQKYWTLHMDEFFDHLLLGAPRPQWMDLPVPYLERGKRDLVKAFGNSPNH